MFLSQRVFSVTVAVVMLATVASCANEPGPAQIQTTKSFGGEIKIVTRDQVSLLTMHRPNERGSVGIGAVELATLPSGCVVVQGGYGRSGLWPVLWPSGTTIDDSGAIIAKVDSSPGAKTQTFRLGQEVRGGVLDLWSASRLKPSKAVTDVCPGAKYIELDGLEVRQK